MSENIRDDIPESLIITTYEGEKFQTHLMGSIDFVRLYVEPATKKIFRSGSLELTEPFYQNLKFFDNSISIPKTNEVVFQTNSGGHVVSFGVFGQRWDYEKFFRIFVISTHPNYQDQGRAREILKCIALRTAEHGVTYILPGTACEQSFDTKKWQECIYRILKDSGINPLS